MVKSNRHIIILSAILLIGIVFFVSRIQTRAKANLQINGQDIKVEVADETAEIVQGLSGRQTLCAGCGMLFVFPDYQIRNFWMKDMNFPLDIAWIKDSTIFGFEENINPVDGWGEISRMSSNAPVNRVLEINAGWLKQSGVKIGDAVAGLD